VVDVERNFTVNKPIGTVVEYLKDFAKAEAWDPGTVSCEPLAAGPVAVGTRWHNVSKIKGKETELTYELTRLEPGRLTFVGKNKTATSTDDLTFAAAEGGGTAITYHADIVFHGLAKLADPLMKHEFEKLGDSTVQSMTDTLNSLA
jgi:carbon monoxide dehydrogenase subunit G